MNEQTVQLLRDLATKLGTTTEYLWSVLIKQAQIEAVSHLVVFAVTWVIAFVSIRLAIKIYHKYKDIEESEVYYIVAFGIAFVLNITALMTLFKYYNGIINGFFNPEYWALQQILSKM